MLRYKNCRAVVLVAFIISCVGLTASLFATTDTSGLSQEARVTVRNYLLASGKFPDMLSVSGGIEVSFKDAPTVWEVGKTYSLTAEIKNKFGASMQGKAVELLVLDGKQVLSALQQGEGSGGKIRGVWQGLQVSFNDLSLTRDLPQSAQLVVVTRGEQGSYMFYAQAFPISSSAATVKLGPGY